MATTSSTRVVEGTLTNGQRRKLNALRKSVGNEIGAEPVNDFETVTIAIY